MKTAVILSIGSYKLPHDYYTKDTACFDQEGEKLKGFQDELPAD